MIAWVLGLLLLLPLSAQATTYYISPSGSDANNGLSTGAPFLTFAYAINASRAWCGDTLFLVDGTYGDGTSTGKISISAMTCTSGDEFTIRSVNQRQAKIVDNGSGRAVRVAASAYIIVDGLYAVSADNSSYAATSEAGEPFQVRTSNHVTLRNNVAKNVNRYPNSHIYDVLYSQDILLEDNEAYVFHRHCVDGWQSERVVVRRQYCNPRGGAISGGFGAGNGLNRADALFSMYPCKDCILENAIADGTTSSMYLSEMNATFGSSLTMSGSKVLGSICYKCQYGNGIYINSRSVADLNHTPQNITVRDVAFPNWGSTNGNWSGMRVSDCVGCTIDHITILNSVGTGAYGMYTDDNASVGVAAASNTVTITNALVSGFTDAATGSIPNKGTGIFMTGFDTWTVDETISTGNRVAYNPSSDPVSATQTLSNTSTAAHGMGTCSAWVPAGATGSGAGTGGSDIGATILYRYTDGTLSSVPLWDPVTGAFPHGATDLDGTNAVVGDSLADFHERVNVNTNGCSFPAGYGGSTPTNPGNIVSSTDLTGAHIHVIDPGTDALLVGVAVRWDDYLNTAAAQPNGLTSSCGSEAISALDSAWFTPDGNRVMRLYGKINPTSGTCTLTPTFNTANWSGWTMVSIAKENVASFGPVASNSALSAAANVTISTNADETVVDFLATSNAPTIAAGANQIWTTDRTHSTKALRLASSEQAGVDGGLMTWSLSGTFGWIMQGVSLVPSGGAGGAATFTLSKYRIDGLLGSAGTPEVTLGALAAQDTPGRISTTGYGRIRAEITIGAETAPSTSIALYCRKNGGSYVSVTNSFGGNSIRLYGPGVHPNIPSSGTPTTQRFSGTFIAGTTVRDSSVAAQLPSIPSGTRTEVDYQIVLGNGAVAGDVFDCQIRKAGGATFDTYTVTPSILAVGASASMGF